MEATMVKTFMTMTAVSALMLGSALAQSTPSPKTDQAAPPAASSTMPKSNEAAPPPAASSTMPKSTDQAAAPAAGSTQVVTSQQADQWVASKFEGTDVLGPDNKKVGDVSDILFDQTGQIHAYIVSVGGFLGMGSKYIALPPSAFQVVTETPAATTGSATTNAAASLPAEKKLKISMTEDQLKQAANFEYYKEPSRAAAPAPTGSRPMGAPSGMKQ
jgi:hypothetical protein